MKLLVVARRLHIDRSSEGICSSKFVMALARAGIDMVCLTRDDVSPDPGSSAPFSVSWLPGVRLFHTQPFAPRRSVLQRVHAASIAGRGAAAVAARKADSALFYLTGHRLDGHQDIRTWQRAVAALIERERPDAILVRGEGTAFDPHIALARLKPSVPWIAHYHDPYPSSLYPAPYRSAVPFASPAQERRHRAVVRECSALTFPSERLLQWVLQGRLARYRRKGFVLPHLASDLFDEAPEHASEYVTPGTFTLVHTGALLGPRSPVGLVDGFRRFISGDPDGRARARLVMVGPVNRAHSSDAAWSTLVNDSSIRCIDARITYRASLALARQASVNVIIEATGASVSPFLPAKLSDYVSLQRPILALSIRESAVADVLGADFPFVVPPDDGAAVAAAIERLWDAWRAGREKEGVASPAIQRRLSEAAVIEELRRALRSVNVDTKDRTVRQLSCVPSEAD